MGINELSLFDGKSSLFTASEMAGIEVDNYYSAEVDKYAIKVSDAIHPNQTRLGDVTKWREWDIDWASIDLVTGGFPCQAWSMAGKQMGDKDERGMLFWVMLDIMKHVRHHNPKADFLIENVKMKKEFEEYITHHTQEALGEVHKILINSALMSAQNRNRYYWTSFPVTQPESRGIVLADIIESGIADRVKSRSVISSVGRTTLREYFLKSQGVLIFFVGRGNNPPGFRAVDGKSPALTSNSWQHNNFIAKETLYRKATPRECFRLQTVPEHYIDKILDCGVSNTQLYKIAGNGWTDEVITHILRCMK